MGANIGQTYEQTKALDGFPYNKVGETWIVNSIQGKYIVLKNGSVGLGVDEQELKDHFKLNTSYSDCDNDYDGDGVEEEDVEEIEEEIEETIQDTDSDNKEVGKLNKFLRKLGFGKKN